MFKKDVLPITDLLNKRLRDCALETPLLQIRLINSWGKVMGSMIDSYTTQKFIKNQVLFVKINNAALRQDLSMGRSHIVQKLNQELGTALISDIRFF